MVQTSLNIFDLGVILVIGLSALLSFFRGFMREVLSLGAWIAASMITLYNFPTVSAWIEPQVKSQVIASGLASMGTFFVSLIGISILTSIVLKFLKTGAEVGFIDNLVGLLFGAARGALVLAIAYFMMTLVLSEKDYPDWVKQAYTRPYVAKMSNWLAHLAPEYLESFLEKTKNAEEKLRGDSQSADELEDAVRKLSDNPEVKKALEKSEESLPEGELPDFDDLQQRLRERKKGH